MQVSVDAGEGLERRMTVELPSGELENRIDKRLRDLSRNLRMDGFRPGKVPLSVIRKRFGEQVRQEAIGELVESTFFDAAKSQDLNPAGMPRIELLDSPREGFVAYQAVFEVMPEVEVGELSSVTVKKPVAEVSKEDVDRMIERLREQRATFNEVERPAADGDRVTVDFTGTVDGETFDGGSAEDVPVLLGSHAMIDGFEEGLIGARAGETRSLDLEFPEDFHDADLAGKAAHFEVTVKKVEERVLPETDAGFVQSFGVEDGELASLRAEIRANMERELKQRLRAKKREAIMEALLSVVEFPVPTALIKAEIGAMKENMRQEMEQAGQRTSVDLPDDLFHEAAERRVRLSLALGKIVDQYEITLDQERVEAMIEELASSYENPDEVIEFYRNDPEQRRQIENAALGEQVADKLLEEMTVEEERHEFDKLMKA